MNRPTMMVMILDWRRAMGDDAMNWAAVVRL
jgi:hypothetical protein